MATKSRHNGTSVSKVKLAAGGLPGGHRGKTNVSGATKPAVKSSSTMASGVGVKLGTTRGNHNVSHPLGY